MDEKIFLVAIEFFDLDFNDHKTELSIFDKDVAVAVGKKYGKSENVSRIDVVNDETGEVVLAIENHKTLWEN